MLCDRHGLVFTPVRPFDKDLKFLHRKSVWRVAEYPSPSHLDTDLRGNVLLESRKISATGGPVTAYLYSTLFQYPLN